MVALLGLLTKFIDLIELSARALDTGLWLCYYIRVINQTNMFKSISTLIIGSLAMATPALAASDHSAHVRLARAVEKTGITVYVNPNICDTDKTFGFYDARNKAVVICQENKVTGSTDAVNWTEEDYDTLRHEIHHVVQDCRDGLNGTLHAVYKKPIELAIDTIGLDAVKQLAEVYSDSSKHIQVMEFEAFAVAALNDPDEQVSDIVRFCF